LESSLDAAKSQLHTDDEEIATQATADVQNIERHIFEYRISVRERVIADHFSQKEYRDKRNNTKITVITVANKCHEQHMLGTDKAILPVEMTGIKDLRAYLCETPSKDRVRAFARRSEHCINKIRRIFIWADGPKMPPRDAAMAVFEQHTHCEIKEHKASLTKALIQYKKSLITRNASKWGDLAEKKMEEWADTYPARTQGVFIRQGGRHSPKLKAKSDEQPGKKKTRIISWPGDLLIIIEDDVMSLLKSTEDVINGVERSVCEHIRNTVEKIKHGLETLDTIGGANLEDVFKLFEGERDACMRDVETSIKELVANLR
jgi:predicted CopG family antitoxin